MSLHDLMAAWSRAWAISRHVDPPKPVDGGGWRIEVGKPDQRRRFLFDELDAGVLRPLAEKIDEPFVFLKVCSDARTMRAILPDGYRASVERDGPFIRVEIHTGEALAASGQVILLEGLAVYDQIVTQEGHRRRGLGSALILTLKAAAAEAGVTSGALSSSLMGRPLYLSLGWRRAADYTTAASPGTSPFP